MNSLRHNIVVPKHTALRALALGLTLSACASRLTQAQGEPSAPLDIGTPTGQILGKLDGEAHICVHSFHQGTYKISDQEQAGSTRCGRNVRRVEARRVSFGGQAFLPWLEEVQPGENIALDMRYATSQIFPDGRGGWRINQPLYGQGRCFLEPKAKQRLLAAGALLKQTRPDLVLLMLDCYRPQYVSQIMWDLIQDPEWVAANGKSGHNKGGTADLTLAVNKADGPEPVDMGSAFDLFDPRSHYGAVGLTEAQRNNRKLLRTIMEDAGWSPYDSEWWHFSLEVANTHLDLPL